jgi:hypothetical protein
MLGAKMATRHGNSIPRIVLPRLFGSTDNDMKKVLLIFGMLILVFSLSGCSVIGGFFTDESTITERMAKYIVSALDTHDEDALKAVFSPKALEEANDLDVGIQYTFSLYSGPSVEIEKWKSSGSYHYGSPGNTKKVDAFFIVTTDQSKYYLYFEYWYVQEADSRAIGIAKIKLSDFVAANETQDFWYGLGYNRPGIYHPGWDVQPDSAV